MATSFDTFRFPPARPHSEFIPYSGPPAPKPASRRSPPGKTPSIVDEWHDIDEILGIGVESKTTSHRIEFVDLTCLDGGVNDEVGDGSDTGGAGSDFCSQDEQENVRPKRSGSPGKVVVERRDKNLIQPAIAEDSEENAIDFNEYQTEPDTNTDHEVGHPPKEEHNSTQKDNQLKGWGISAPECLEKECSPTGMEDVTNSEMVEGARTQDDLLPCTSDSGKATESVRFADQLSMPDTECRDTPERRRVISGIDGGARSDCFTDQPTQGAIDQKQGTFTALENVSCSSHGDSDGDDDDDDYDDNYDRTTGKSLLSSKRKRFPPADPATRKRHSRKSNTTSKRYFEHGARSAKRQKPSSFRGRPPSNDNLSSHTSSDTSSDTSSGNSRDESGDCGRRLRSNERLKSTVSLNPSHKHKSKRGRDGAPPSRTNTSSTFPSSTLPSPQAAVEARLWPSAEGTSLGQAYRELPDIAIHPLSSDIAFLTALIREFGDTGTFSSSQAVTFLESHVGYPAKLNNITVKPLPSGVWFLTCLIRHSCDIADLSTGYMQLNKVSHYVDQPEPALSGLAATRVGVVAPRDDDSSDDDDEHSSDMGADTGDEPSSSTKNSPWSQRDDDRLSKWKKDGKPWGWIHRQFPHRTPAAVKGRWYTKLRRNARR